MPLGVEPYCLGYNLVVALHNTLPLLICGTVRAVMVYVFDYQQPVEEYGVYWNFFFTLAAVCAAGQLVKIPPKFSALAGASSSQAHQHFLTNRGIGEFIRGDKGRRLASAQQGGRVLAPGLLRPLPHGGGRG